MRFIFSSERPRRNPKRMSDIQFWSLPGLTSYEEASELQQKLVELRAKDAITDTILFLEHAPVITRGRGLQQGGRVPMVGALPPDIAFAETERGGDLTYHGPGQLVVYPICKLDGLGFGPRHDVTGFLRKLERLLIDELAELQLVAHAKANATGVWVADRKVASIGIAVRRWVTYHGVAINVVNDLKPFHLISPCGFSPEVMTRLADLVLDPLPMNTWRPWLEERLQARFSGGSSASAGSASVEQVQELLARNGVVAEHAQH